MYYYGYFRDTDLSTDKLGNLYKIVIITNFRNKEYTNGGELLLSNSPFTVSWSGEEDNLFKGYKCSTATVGFYQENYNFEFNNTKENNVYVALLKLKIGKRIEDDLGITTDGDIYDIVWTGYGTPNAYSQEYSSSLDYFELECQDALSTLKYKVFSGDNVSGNTYSCFSDILIKYIGGLGNYKHIYTSSSLVLPTQDLGGILEFIYINELNFFDEDKKASNVLDVLNEICIYLGLTMIPWGDSIYILDYHSLETGEYYEIYSKKNGDYSFLSSMGYSDWAIGDSCNFINHRDILKEDFISSDTTLSLGSTYNKVTVTSDLYGLETVLCDFTKKENYTYVSTFDTIGDTYGSSVVSKVSKMGTVIDTTYKIENSDGDEETKYQKTVYKFKYLNTDKAKEGNFLNALTTRWYNLDTKYVQDGTLIDYYGTTKQREVTYNDLQTKVGSAFVEYNSNEVGSLDDSITGEKTTAIIMSLHNSQTINDKNSSGYDDSIQNAINHAYGWRNIWNDKGDTIIRTEDVCKQILLTVNTKKILIGHDDYIIIKGNFTFYDANGYYVPLAGDSNSTILNQMSVAINCHVWCTLSDDFGNYWDGKVWKKRSEFLIPSFVSGETTTLGEPKFRLALKFQKGVEAFGTSFAITSYMNEDVDIESEGYAIPAPPSATDVKPTTLNLSIYRPWGVSGAPADLAILQDFDMTIAGKNYMDIVDSDDDSNTSYTNTLDTEALEEYPDIEFKITSWDKKQINLSSTYWLKYSPKSLMVNPVNAGYDFSRVETIHNKATGQIGRPEELAIYNYGRQYSTPTASLNLSLFNSLGITPYSTLEYHFLQGKTFVVDGMSIDYAYDIVRLTLIERK